MIDTSDGRFFHLNRSAAAICEALASQAASNVALAALAARLGVATSTIERHAESLLHDLAHHAGIRLALPGRFKYGAVPGGYELSYLGEAVLRLSNDGRTLSAVPGEATTRLPMLDCVRAIAPKILTLEGIAVLHGASVQWKGAALGICGVSRAGKTTTARLLAASGRAELVSEDLIVVAREESRRPSLYVTGESRVHRWASEASTALQAEPFCVQTSGLVAAASGSTLPIETIWFVDVARRRTDLRDRIELRRLGPTEAATLVLQHAFLGAADSESWRRHLEATRVFSSRIEAYEASLPAGLAELRAALDNYTISSAS